MKNNKKYPYLGFGMGLRVPHYDYIFSKWPKVDFFEIVSENFMDTEGKPIRMLEKVLSHYKVIMHGVSLSIGTTDTKNSDYLKKLKKLADKIDPLFVSDHLCWTGVAHKNMHDLLPVPYTEESLKHIVQKIKEVQDYLERPLVLENPSTYLEFKDSQMEEWEFIARMLEDADCGLLLDVNNVYVTCYNHRKDPKEYIDAIPSERIAYTHLAGHTNMGSYVVDTHEGEVIDEVWDIYRYVISRAGKLNTMIEWDENIPDFKKVYKEVKKAMEVSAKAEKVNNLPNFSDHYKDSSSGDSSSYHNLILNMQEAILGGNVEKSNPEKWIKNKKDFSSKEQLAVYLNAYRHRLFDISDDDYPVLRHYLGDENMNELLNSYIESHVSNHFSISKYINAFPEFIESSEKISRHKNADFAYEIAMLETGLSLIFDMEETKPLNIQKFSDINPDDFLSTKINLRAASRLFRFRYPVNKYYKEVMDKKNPEEPGEQESYLVVYRHKDAIWRLDLEEYEYLLLEYLFSDLTVGEALEKLLENEDVDMNSISSNLQGWFSRWSSNGILAEAA